MIGYKYDVLAHINQLRFPLCACSKEVIKSYRPYLEKIDLVYHDGVLGGKSNRRKSCGDAMQIAGCVKLNAEETKTLYTLLCQVLNSMNKWFLAELIKC